MYMKIQAEEPILPKTAKKVLSNERARLLVVVVKYTRSPEFANSLYRHRKSTG